MKKYKILFILLLFVSAKVFSQKADKKLNELKFMYIDEKYDKVIAKGEALM